MIRSLLSLLTLVSSLLVSANGAAQLCPVIVDLGAQAADPACPGTTVAFTGRVEGALSLVSPTTVEWFVSEDDSFDFTSDPPVGTSTASAGGAIDFSYPMPEGDGGDRYVTAKLTSTTPGCNLSAAAKTARFIVGEALSIVSATVPEAPDYNLDDFLSSTAIGNWFVDDTGIPNSIFTPTAPIGSQTQFVLKFVPTENQCIEGQATLTVIGSVASSSATPVLTAAPISPVEVCAGDDVTLSISNALGIDTATHKIQWYQGTAADFDYTTATPVDSSDFSVPIQTCEADFEPRILGLLVDACTPQIQPLDWAGSEQNELVLIWSGSGFLADDFGIGRKAGTPAAADDTERSNIGVLGTCGFLDIPTIPIAGDDVYLANGSTQIPPNAFVLVSTSSLADQEYDANSLLDLGHPVFILQTECTGQNSPTSDRVVGFFSKEKGDKAGYPYTFSCTSESKGYTYPKVAGGDNNTLAGWTIGGRKLKSNPSCGVLPIAEIAEIVPLSFYKAEANVEPTIFTTSAEMCGPLYFRAVAVPKTAGVEPVVSNAISVTVNCESLIRFEADNITRCFGDTDDLELRILGIAPGASPLITSVIRSVDDNSYEERPRKSGATNGVYTIRNSELPSAVGSYRILIEEITDTAPDGSCPQSVDASIILTITEGTTSAKFAVKGCEAEVVNIAAKTGLSLGDYNLAGTGIADDGTYRIPARPVSLTLPHKDSKSCQGDAIIDVTPSANVNINFLADTVCVAGDIVNLNDRALIPSSAGLPGGEWSISNSDVKFLQGDRIDYQGLQAINNVTATYTPNNLGCTTVEPVELVLIRSIEPKPIPSTVVCAQGDELDLGELLLFEGFDAPGRWLAGPGVNTEFGELDPTALTLGQTYTYTFSPVCSLYDDVSSEVTVEASVEDTIRAFYCAASVNLYDLLPVGNRPSLSFEARAGLSQAGVLFANRDDINFEEPLIVEATVRDADPGDCVSSYVFVLRSVPETLSPRDTTVCVTGLPFEIDLLKDRKYQGGDFDLPTGVTQAGGLLSVNSSTYPADFALTYTLEDDVLGQCMLPDGFLTLSVLDTQSLIPQFDTLCVGEELDVLALAQAANTEANADLIIDIDDPNVDAVGIFSAVGVPAGRRTILADVSDNSNGCYAPLAIHIYVADTVRTEPLSITVCSASDKYNLLPLQDPKRPGGEWFRVPSGKRITELDVSVAGEYMLRYVYDLPRNDTCFLDGIAVVTVLESEAGTALRPDTLCIGDGEYALDQLLVDATAEGTWADAVSGDVVTVFEPITAGNFRFVFTPGTGDAQCSDTSSTTLTVLPKGVSLAYSLQVCEGSIINLLDSLSLPAGIGSLTFSDADDRVMGSTFDATDLTADYNISISFAKADSCYDDALISIVLADCSTDEATPSAGSWCNGTDPLVLSNFNDPRCPGGTWSQPDGTVITTWAGPADEELTYTPPTASACTAPGTALFTVAAGVGPQTIPFEACRGGEIDLLSLVADGTGPLTFTDIHVNAAGILNTDTFTVERYTVIGTSTATGACAGDVTFELILRSVLAVNPSDLIICELSVGSGIDLTPLEDPLFPGGTWSGNDRVNGSTFTPPVDTGTFTLLYDAAPSATSECATPGDAVITVLPAGVSPTLVGSVCRGGELDLSALAAASVLDLPDLSYPTPVSADGVFTPAPSFTGTTNLFATFPISADDCYAGVDFSITVTVPDTVIANDATLCAAGEVLDLNTLFVRPAPAGSWSQAQGVDGTLFDPALAAAGATELLFTPADGLCADTAAATIRVVDQIPLGLTDASTCAREDSVLLAELFKVTDLPEGTWFVDGTPRPSGFFVSDLIGEVGYTVRYEPNSSCSAPDSAILQVEEPTRVRIRNGAACAAGGTLDLNTLLTVPTSGTWRGGSNVAPDGTFNASGLANGEYEVVFEPADECTVSFPGTVTVGGSVTPQLQRDTACVGQGPLDLSLLVDPSFPIGVWTGPGVSGNSFDPSGLTGAINLTFNATGNACAAPGGTTILVRESIGLELQKDTICSDATFIPYDLSVLVDPDYPLGDWEGIGFDTDGSTINFNLPGTPQTGPWRVRFIPTASCVLNSETIVELGTSVTPVLTTDTVCLSVVDYPLTIVGDARYPEGSWNGQGTDQRNGFLNPDNGIGTYSISFKPDGVCTNIGETVIEVVDTPIDVRYEDTVVCATGAPFDLNVLLDYAIPGVWEGGDTFDPAGATAGETVTLEFTPDDQGCYNATSIAVEVQTGLGIPDQPLCVDGDPLVFASLLPAGVEGIFRIAGEERVRIAPTTEGTSIVNFTPTDGCPEQFEVVVGTGAALNLETASVCNSLTNYELRLLIPDGVVVGGWVGNGVSADSMTLDASQFAPGDEVDLTLYITGGSACAKTGTTTVSIIEVGGVPTRDRSVCAGSAPFSLDSLLETSIAGTWMGDFLSANNTQFEPGTLAAGTATTLTFTPTGANGCGVATAVVTITGGGVEPLEGVTLSMDDAPLLLSTLLPDGTPPGAWTLGGNPLESFDPANYAAGGPYELTFVSNSECTFSFSVGITVTAGAVVVVGDTIQVCRGNGPIDLSTVRPSGQADGVWRESAAPGNVVTSVPVASGADVVLLYTPPGGEEVTIILSPRESILVDLRTERRCVDDPAFDLNLLLPPGAPPGDWLDASDQAIDNLLSEDIEAGVYTFTYAPTNSGGTCFAPTPTTLVVDGTELPTLIKDELICAADTAYNLWMLLGEGNPTGTWSGPGVNSETSILDASKVLPFRQDVTLTYRAISACDNIGERTFPVDIILQPASAITVSSEAVCASDSAFVLTDLLSDPSTPGTWSLTAGGGVLTSDSYDARTANQDSARFVFSPTAGGDCIQPAEVALPIREALDFPNKTIRLCSESATITLDDLIDGQLPPGGRWFINDVEAIEFNPAARGNDTYTVRYEAGPNICIGQASFQVIVGDDVALTFEPLALCSSDGPTLDLNEQLPLGADGGSWSGRGVDPASSILTLTQLRERDTLTYTPAPGGCYSDEAELFVSYRTGAPIGLEPSLACEAQGALDLRPLIRDPDVTGMWSGSPAVNGSNFDATGLSSGSYTLTFTPDEQGFCYSASTVDIEVIEGLRKPNLLADTVCSNGQEVFFSVLLDSTEYKSGVWSGSNNLQNDRFNPTEPGLVRLMFAANAQCVDTASTTILVVPDNGDIELLSPEVSVCGSTYNLFELVPPGFVARGNWFAEGQPVPDGQLPIAGRDTGIVNVEFVPVLECYGLPSGSFRLLPGGGQAVVSDLTVCAQPGGVIDLNDLLSQDASYGEGTWRQGNEESSELLTSIAGNFTVVFIPSDPCIDPGIGIVNVQPNDTVPAISEPTACSDAGQFQLSALLSTPRTPGSWSGSGVVGEQTLDVSALAGESVSLVFNPDGDCSESSRISLLIESCALAACPDLDAGGFETASVGFCGSSISDLGYLPAQPLTGEQFLRYEAAEDSAFTNSLRSRYALPNIASLSGDTLYLRISLVEPQPDGSECLGTTGTLLLVRGASITTDLFRQLCFNESLTVEGEVFDIDRQQGQVVSDLDAEGCTQITNVELNFGDKDYVLSIDSVCNDGVLIDLNAYLVPQPILQGTWTGDGVNAAGLWNAAEGNTAGPTTITFTPNGEDCTTREEYVFDVVAVSGFGRGAFDATCNADGSSYTATYEIIGTGNLGVISTTRGTITDDVVTISGLSSGELVTFDLSSRASCATDFTTQFSFKCATGTEVPIDVTGTYCANDTVRVSGRIFEITNPRQDFVSGTAPNDTLYRVNLTFLDEIIFELNQTLCTGEGIFVAAERFDESRPTGSVTLREASADGCDSTVVVNLSFTRPPSLRVVAAQELCLEGDFVRFAIEVDGTSTVTGNVVVNGDDLGPITLTPGINQLVYRATSDFAFRLIDIVANDAVVCQIADEQALSYRPRISRLSADIITPPSGVIVSCSELGIPNLAAMPSRGVGPFRYAWSTGDTTSSIANVPVGSYSVMITDAFGCEATDAADVVPGDPIGLTAQSVDPSCAGGVGSLSVSLDEFVEGIEYRFGEGEFLPVTSADFVTEGLPAGTYLFALRQANGCAQDTLINLVDPDAINLVVPDTITVDLGDSLEIVANIPVGATQVSWTPSAGLGCTDCASVTTAPAEDTRYFVTATTAEGCEVTDEVFVVVRPVVGPYLPSAFSPNDDGINDVYVPEAGPEIALIKRFLIFDRWGNTVHVSTDFLPGDAVAGGWNGQYGGEPMNAGVYVIVVEAQIIDGTERMFTADITLIR